MPAGLNPVTADRVKAVCPHADGDIIEAIVTAAPGALPAAGLNDPVRISHFLAQIATETGGLRRLDENLNYTTVKRLREIFSSKFKTDDSAKGYIRNPEKLANFVYAGRIGNSKPGDGWKYRGSGLIQITGRENFDKIGRLVGLDLVDDPELARKSDSALEIAIGYWTKRNVNSVAGDASEDAVKRVTKLINPSLVGLAERTAYFRKALKVFSATAAVPLEGGRAKQTGARRFAVAAAASTPADSDLSGPQWVKRFPTSRDVDDLQPAFAKEVAAFLDALKAASAKVDISATYRPKERAYLMHWAWLISREKFDPAKVPPMPGVAIRWDHGTLAKSRAAAKQMVDGYGMAFIAVLNSKHTERLAIDMTLAWKQALSIKRRNGSKTTITSQPRNGSNSELIAVGAEYGVIKLPTDPPHWSDDGR